MKSNKGGLMGKVMALIRTEALQFAVYGLLSLLLLVGTGILYDADREIYQRFFGRFNPIGVMVVVILIGALCLGVLLWRGWLAIYRPENWPGLLVAAGLALLFGLVMISADWRMVMPADINILLPKSLIYYPTLGFVVDIIFQVLPLTILLLLLSGLVERYGFSAVIWPVILFVALLEPVFQVLVGGAEGVSKWGVAFIAGHIFLINLAQLWLFKRYDFVTMYGFRLVYYLVWHIVWGQLRLGLLF